MNNAEIQAKLDELHAERGPLLSLIKLRYSLQFPSHDALLRNPHLLTDESVDVLRRLPGGEPCADNVARFLDLSRRIAELQRKEIACPANNGRRLETASL
jgi:hypothetical protein